MNIKEALRLRDLGIKQPTAMSPTVSVKITNIGYLNAVMLRTDLQTSQGINRRSENLIYPDKKISRR